MGRKAIEKKNNKMRTRRNEDELDGETELSRTCEVSLRENLEIAYGFCREECW